MVLEGTCFFERSSHGCWPMFDCLAWTTCLVFVGIGTYYTHKKHKMSQSNTTSSAILTRMLAAVEYRAATIVCPVDTFLLKEAFENLVSLPPCSLIFHVWERLNAIVINHDPRLGILGRNFMLTSNFGSVWVWTTQNIFGQRAQFGVPGRPNQTEPKYTYVLTQDTKFGSRSGTWTEPWLPFKTGDKQTPYFLNRKSVDWQNWFLNVLFAKEQKKQDFDDHTSFIRKWQPAGVRDSFFSLFQSHQCSVKHAVICLPSSNENWLWWKGKLAYRRSIRFRRWHRLSFERWRSFRRTLKATRFSHWRLVDGRIDAGMHRGGPTNRDKCVRKRVVHKFPSWVPIPLVVLV